MSRKIHIESIELDVREQIMNELQIKLEGSKYVHNSKPTYIYPIEVGEEYAYIPFAYGRTCIGGPYDCPGRENYPKLECKFEGTLRSHQKVIKTEAISHLNKYGSTIIAGYPGIGKTAMAIYIATKIKLKVLIVSHRIVLINQWKKAIERFCPNSTFQVLTTKSKKKDCDFYIMNASNVPKHECGYYEDIGFMIVDEVHLIMAEGLSKCMQRIVPRYVIGLSATPYREDGLNILLDLYFGKRKIYRKLFREHTAYKIKTNFVPTVEFSANGRVNWGVILDTQAHDIARNEMIVRLIKYFPKRVFLVLCKRVIQGNYLVKRLQEEGEDVTSLIGKQQEFDHDSRILVGINSKTGTGFDHPRLDAMILASDVQAYFIQYLGRCMRTEDVIPIVFDIVDKNPILDLHYKVRRATYLEHGGKIKDFAQKYPDFEIV
jgi:superfamily II DNA or RNA helicase